MKKHLKNGAVLVVFFATVTGMYFLNNGQQSAPVAAGAEKNVATEDATPSVSVEPVEIIHGGRSKKQVIFTFDGGSGAESGEAILEALKKHGVAGTFFLTGKFAEENPELVKKIAREGHAIFNHTYSHRDLTTLSDADIKKELARTEAILSVLTGKTTKPYFRAPYGARNERVRAIAAKEGYQSVYWTVDVLDWKESEGMTRAAAQTRIFENLQPGAIFLMHVGDTITGAILDDVFTEIKSRGYAIVSLMQGI